jgi:small ligand-binding sensory domain FIST
MINPQKPRFASSLSTLAESARAEEQALEGLLAGLGGVRPDLVCIFVSHHHGEAIEELGPRVAAASGAEVILGCTGEGIIGAAREIEHEPALALWGAHLPGTTLRPFAATASMGPDQQPVFSALPDVQKSGEASILLLADPFSFPMDDYLKQLNEAMPGVPAVGGMASGGMGPGQNLLIGGQGLVDGGVIGLVLEGGIEVHVVVSPGCKPVGKPWVVTACDQNLVSSLGGRPAIDVLMETLKALPPDDQQHFQRRPFMGLAIDPSRSDFRPGDFLARQIMGLQAKENAIAVADLLRRGQTVQFLVQDADSASDDLTTLMDKQGGGPLQQVDGAGALLFSCNGRGSRMFDKPDHDISCVRLGLDADVPVAGFFAMGEIGPVSGRNFLHGFTASVAVFRPRS